MGSRALSRILDDSITEKEGDRGGRGGRVGYCTVGVKAAFRGKGEHQAHLSEGPCIAQGETRLFGAQRTPR